MGRWLSEGMSDWVSGFGCGDGSVRGKRVRDGEMDE